MKKRFLILALVLAAAVLANADIYVKSKVHTDAMSFMGQTQPEKNDLTEQWIRDDKFASLSQGQSFIVDLKKNVMFMINHKNKSYIEATLPVDFSKLLPPEAAAMMSMIQMRATVNPTTEKKKIGQWNCTRYEVKFSVMGMAMNMNTWATEDVPFDVAQFNTRIYANVLKGQMRLDEASMKEMMKIKGFSIASETTSDIMGTKMRSTTEVIEISKKNPPAGVYVPPAGYTKKDKLSQADLQGK